MTELSINTPALLFPAITLLMLAYTNRFLSLGSLVRKLHDQYAQGNKQEHIIGQIQNIRGRINLIRYMQGFGVVSFLCCVLCMFLIFRGEHGIANFIFGLSLLFLLVSIVLSLLEINKSTKAIELELSDIEELLGQGNIFKDMVR
jgi:Protein of unknown function (DUF2721)